ncbi:hypothetical protein NDU88_001311 [Pleurodeles waltl]|uniref:Uncharacterized protein n=1 Tax=Pleurodeles waltl TaxID=8319 RepID=A0AAV7T060_PLEWA|nr:hypothetical protein NDU88_001311 [Pleurodeles waltl]
MQRRASQRGRRAVQVIILPAVGLPVHPICCRQDLRFWSLQEESPTPCQSSPARWATVSRCAQDPRCRRVARLRRASSPAAQSETRWFGPGRGWCLPQDRVAPRGRGSRGRPPRPRRPQQPGGTPTPGNNGAQSQISGDNSNQHGADPRRHTPRRAISVQLEPSWAQGAPPPSFRGHPGNDHRHRSHTAPRGHRRSGLPISPPRGASCPLVSSPSVPPQPGSTRPRLPGGRPTTLRPASPLGTPICSSHLGAGPRTASAPCAARRTSQDRGRSPPAGPRARSPPGHTNPQGATPGAMAPRQWPHPQSPLTSSFAPSQRHLNSARGGPSRQPGRSRSAVPIGPGNPGALPGGQAAPPPSPHVFSSRYAPL